jgi:hypothetical protein
MLMSAAAHGNTSRAYCEISESSPFEVTGGLQTIRKVKLRSKNGVRRRFNLDQRLRGTGAKNT